MPLFNKYVPLGDEHKELADRLLELARRANTKVRGVFKFDMSKRTKAANAALTGIGNTRRIVLGDTLINEFSTDEIETVLAHELGHHVHRDIPFLIAFGTLSTTLSLYLASLALNWAVGYFGFTGPADIAAFSRAGIDLRRLWPDHHAARKRHSPAGGRTWRTIMPCSPQGRRKRSHPPLRAWQTKTWGKSTPRSGWSGCSIHILRWASGSRKRITGKCKAQVPDVKHQGLVVLILRSFSRG
jgi:hypothetical protein